MLYGRYLDIHIGHLGQYDFETDIVSQMEREGTKLSHGRNRANWSPWAGGQGRDLRAPIQKQELPERGVIVIGVEISDIDQKAAMAGMTALVEWVNDKAHTGKIRFNVHGSETGDLAMGSRAGAWMHTDATNAALWLLANGLSDTTGGKVTRALGVKGGLNTVGFAICMGGRNDTESAKYKAIKLRSKPAPGSTVRKFGSCLRANGVTGIKITGSNEIVAGGSGKYAGTTGRSVSLPWGPGFERKMKGPKGTWLGTGILKIPAPFVIDPRGLGGSRGRITFPAGYAATLDSASDAWVIHDGVTGIAAFPTVGWIVDAASRTIQGPLGWTMKPKKPGEPGGEIRFTLQNTSVDMNSGVYWQRLTNTPFKITMTT
jgi:hypothetical protein